jgi:predicted O-methyltransferase YrrM
MRSIYLNEELLSRCFWAVVHEHLKGDEEIAGTIREIVSVTREIQKKFPSGVAGSVGRATVGELLGVARYFSPRKICEVGTYIGRSALGLIAGAPESIVELHTCDFSFDQFDVAAITSLPQLQRSKINYYPKTSSTQMFQQLLRQGMNGDFDFFYIDGRINPEDVGLIKNLMTEDAVFVLDDFEGIEKGVINATMLLSGLNGYFLLRPSIVVSDFNQVFGKTAILAPTKLLNVTRQQLLPFGMASL